MYIMFIGNAKHGEIEGHSSVTAVKLALKRPIPSLKKDTLDQKPKSDNP